VTDVRAPAAATADRAAMQRRTMLVLIWSVIPTSAALTAAFAATAVLAEDITGSETLAGLAAGSLSVGSVAAAFPLARLMSRRGRRRGLVTGWSIAGAGMAAVSAAAITELYPLLVAGIVAIGAGQSANLSTRYAAADLAPEDRRGRAIGMLVWATTFGAVAGPSIALGPASSAAGWLSLPDLAGPYLLGLAMFTTGVAVTHLRLRPDPLEVAGAIAPAAGGQRARPAGARAHRGSDEGASSSPRATPVLAVAKRIASRPAARLAVLAMLTGQAVMVGIMTMTPLHMSSGDHELRIIGFVISLHIVGMYAFSPAVGWLVDRVGPHLVVAGGGVMLFVGAELASHTDPSDSLGVFVGLLLIGLGWSFGLISGSSLLTSAYPADERVEVQGAADMIMTLGGAISGLFAGFAMEKVGYHSFSHWAGMAALILVAAGGVAWFTGRGSPRLRPG